MTLELAGVKLIAEGQAAFVADAKTAASATLGIGTAAEQAAKGMDALAEAAKRAAKIDQLNDKLAVQRKELAILQTELGQTAAKYGDASTQAQRKALAVEKLSQSIARTESALKTEQQALATAERAVASFGDKSEQAGKGVSALERVATGAFHRIGEIAVNATQEAVQALGRFAVDSIKAAGDFEAGTNRMASVVGDSLAAAGISLDAVRAKALEMGAQTQFSAAQAQDAMTELAKGGVPVAQVMGEATEATLNLAAAAEVELSSAASIVAKQLGVWGDAAGGATAVSNLLAQAANASVVGVEDLALGLANAGGSAKIAGLTFQETVTTMAAIASGFSSASDAGTSLKTMLARLQPATKPAAAAMAELGLLTAEGTSKFYDAQGGFIGMAGAAELLKKATEGLSEAQKIQALQTIFGQDAIRAAAMLAEKGAAGYYEMAGAMQAAGTAAEQAKKRQEGFNFAMESLGGSVETLQIVLGSALLPALTSVVNNGLIPAVNGFSGFVQALEAGQTPINTIAGVVSTVFMPTLAGLTTALITYATVQAVQATPAILASIPAIVAQTAAFTANAVAIGLAILPYAALAAAAAVVALTWQDLNAKIASGTTQLLESKGWWNQSAQALTGYAAAAEPVKTALKGKADALANVRTQLQAEMTNLANNEIKWGVNSQQRADAMARINSLANTVKILGGQLQSEIEIQGRLAFTMTTAESRAQALTGATAGLGGAASLTTDELAELEKGIVDTYAKGAEALGAYATTEAAFITGVETRRSEHAAKIAELEKKKAEATTAEQKKGFDEQIAAANTAYQEQETAAASSYAEQQAAQQAHLGQMLIDYTVAQATLGKIGKEEAAKLVGGIKTEFGVMSDTTSETFLRMTASIDTYAKNAGGDITSVINDLAGQRDAAAATQKTMQEGEREYVSTATHNFIEAGGDAQAYANKLKAIPSRVTTEVHTKYTSSGTHGGNSAPGTGGGSAGIGGRASGGPVSGGTPYIVGEKGPELFVPKASGTIIDARETTQMIARAVDGGRKAVRGVADGIAQGANAARRIVDRTASALGDEFGKGAAERVIAQEPTLEQAGSTASSAFGHGATRKIAEQGPAIERAGQEVGGELSRGAGEGARQNSDKVVRGGRDSVTKAAQAIKPTAAQEAAKEIGSPFMRGIVTGVLDAQPHLFDTLGKTKDDILHVFDDMGSKIAATIQDALQSVADTARGFGATFAGILAVADPRAAEQAADQVLKLQEQLSAAQRESADEFAARDARNHAIMQQHAADRTAAQLKLQEIVQRSGARQAKFAEDLATKQRQLIELDDDRQDQLAKARAAETKRGVLDRAAYEQRAAQINEEFSERRLRIEEQVAALRKDAASDQQAIADDRRAAERALVTLEAERQRLLTEAAGASGEKQVQITQRIRDLEQQITAAKQQQARADAALAQRRARQQQVRDALAGLGDEAAAITDPRKRADFIRMRQAQIKELLDAQDAVADAQVAMDTPGGDAFFEAQQTEAAQAQLVAIRQAQEAERAAFAAGLLTGADESGKAIGDGITQAVLASLGTIGTQFASVLSQALGGVRIEPRALGGPVASGRPYLVGEEGPELMIPGRSGRIQPLARPSQMARMAGGGNTYGGNTYQLNVTSQQSVGSIRAEFGLMRVLAGA